MPSANRRKLSAGDRRLVHSMTDGHCAYCGCELELKAMQVDHLTPIKRGGADELTNMLPACRSCNHYKSSQTLEGFRAALERMPDVLQRDSVTYKNAVRFGLVAPAPKPVVFFFERKRADTERG